MMDFHALEVILRHSTTALGAGWAGAWAHAVAARYVCRVNHGAPVSWATAQQVFSRVPLLAPVRAGRRGATRCAGAWPVGCLPRPGVVVMACAAVAFGAAAHTPALLAVLLAGCWLLLLMALIDAGSGYLPDVLTLPFFILGGVHALLLPVPGALVQAGTGVLVAVLLPLLAMAVFWCRHRCAGLGWGDVKLLAGMGVWLGVQGVVLALLLACVSGVCYALVGWWRNRACGPSPGLVAYPFGPFLAAAAGAMLLVFAVAPDARKAVLQCHHYTWPASCVTVPIL